MHRKLRDTMDAEFVTALAEQLLELESPPVAHSVLVVVEPYRVWFAALDYGADQSLPRRVPWKSTSTNELPAESLDGGIAMSVTHGVGHAKSADFVDTLLLLASRLVTSLDASEERFAQRFELAEVPALTDYSYFDSYEFIVYSQQGQQRIIQDLRRRELLVYPVPEFVVEKAEEALRLGCSNQISSTQHHFPSPAELDPDPLEDDKDDFAALRSSLDSEREPARLNWLVAATLVVAVAVVIGATLGFTQFSEQIQAARQIAPGADPKRADPTPTGEQTSAANPQPIFDESLTAQVPDDEETSRAIVFTTVATIGLELEIPDSWELQEKDPERAYAYPTVPSSDLADPRHINAMSTENERILITAVPVASDMDETKLVAGLVAHQHSHGGIGNITRTTARKHAKTASSEKPVSIVIHEELNSGKKPVIWHHRLDAGWQISIGCKLDAAQRKGKPEQPGDDQSYEQICEHAVATVRRAAS